jgi:Kef-type K+ transport system membrane component KefB
MEQQLLFRAVVDLCMLIFLAEIASSINARLKIPRILGTLSTGIIFGPYLVGGINIGGRPIIQFNELVYVFSEVGAVLLLFSAGLHMKFSELLQSGVSTFTTALLGVVAPYFLGLTATVILGYDWYVGMIIGGSLAATSIAISVKCLDEMNKMETPEAKCILGAAVIDDVLALSLASVILAVVVGHSEVSALGMIRTLGTTLVLWFLLTFVSVKLIPRLLIWVSRLEEKGTHLIEIVAILICFGYAALSGVLGLSPLVGAFIAGMAIADYQGFEVVKTFIEKIEIIFVPLFFIVMGGSLDPRSLLTGDFVLILVLSLVAIASKFIGCGLPAMYFLRDKEKGMRVGIGMMSRGEIGLVIASIGITYSIISNEMYAALIAVIFITSLIPPFLLRRSYQKEMGIEL